MTMLPNETETPIERISKRSRRKAELIEKRFRAFHGQSSIEHLADVIRHKNKIIPGCNCHACLKARFVPPKSLGRNYHTRNENI
jgi:hypothetical protein